MSKQPHDVTQHSKMCSTYILHVRVSTMHL